MMTGGGFDVPFADEYGTTGFTGPPPDELSGAKGRRVESV
jgi:hypothetical protein